MWDLKPDAPDEYRGPFKPIATRLPGVRLCEHMPLQAGMMDRLALLRGIRSVENDHFLSEVYTGLPRTAGKRPAFGSVVSRLGGNDSAVPTYVSLEGQTTDEPEDVRVAELIREAALEGVRDELPHSLAVVVDEIVPRAERPPDRPLTDVRATMFVERPSQKAIIIGRQGVRLREVGQVARRDIEALLGVPVFLDLHVKVAKDWQRDPKQLRRLGFD